MFLTKVFYYFIFLFSFYIVSGHHNSHNGINSFNLKKEHHSISTKELRKISEQLFDQHPDHIFKAIKIDFQDKSCFKCQKDEAVRPLLNIPKHLFESLPTVQLMQKLYDNYDLNSAHAEVITTQESLEEDAFIDSLLNTSIMIQAMDFLAKKGYFEKNSNTYKHILKIIWFGMYCRFKGVTLGSSGFEHIFLLEEGKKHNLQGLHNWIYFATEEYYKRVDYLGYFSQKQLADKAAVLKFNFSYLNKTKMSSMFIGTLPEFEIALYTICFFAKPNKNCNVKLGNEKITIQTWVQHSDHGDFIGSSFPKIYD